MISGGPISSLPLSGLAGPLLDSAATLAWIPRLPAAPPRRSALRTDARQYLTGLNISPIPNPAPPVDLTWQPQLPVHPVRYRARRFQPIADCVLVDVQRVGLSWLPILPVHPPRRPVRPPVYQIPFDFSPTMIPLITAWQTVGLLVQRHRTRLRQGVADLIDMTVLLNVAPCVELGNDQVINPTLNAESAILPSMGAETLTPPTLGSEDLC